MFEKETFQVTRVRTRLDRGAVWLTRCLIALAIALFVTYLAAHKLTRSTDTSLVIVEPWVTAALFDGALVSLLILCGAGVWGIIRRNGLGLTACLVSLVGFPALCVASFMYSMGPWETLATLEAPDGHTYYYMDSSFLQGQTLELTRLAHRTCFVRGMDVLARTNGDSPRHWASVIRPDEAVSDGSQLRMSDSGLIVLFRYEQRAFIAYDTKTSKGYSFEDIRSLSPFVLIGPTTKMHAADIAKVAELASAAPRADDASGVPSEATLTEALAHPNPGVRQLAAKLLDMRKTSGNEATAPQE